MAVGTGGAIKSQKKGVLAKPPFSGILLFF
jgi:hypothetical protein